MNPAEKTEENGNDNLATSSAYESPARIILNLVVESDMKSASKSQQRDTLLALQQATWEAAYNPQNTDIVLEYLQAKTEFAARRREKEARNKALLIMSIVIGLVVITMIHLVLLQPLRKVYISGMYSTAYHTRYCRRLDDIREESRIIYYSSEAAQREGRTPCKECNP